MLLRIGAARSARTQEKIEPSKQEYLRQRLRQARQRLEAQDDGLRPEVHQPLRLRGQDHAEEARRAANDAAIGGMRNPS